MLSSQAGLTELLGSAESGQLQEWHSSQTSAMRYRVLFKGLIIGTTYLWGGRVSDTTFYWIFIFWCFVISALCLLAFYCLLGLIFENRRVQFWGGVLFLISFPMLFAYNYPIFVKEDTLAYFWIVLGLIFLIKKKLPHFSLLTIPAVLTREMTGVLPLVFLINYKRKFLNKVIYIIPSVLTFIAIRLIIEGQSYSMLAGFHRNLKLPIESLFFLYICFGFLWLTAVLGWIEFRNKHSENYGREFLVGSFPWAVSIIFITAALFSILRENRITFLAFPWIIILSLMWFQHNRPYIIKSLKTLRLMIPLTAITLTAGMLSVLILNSTNLPTGGILGGHTDLSTILNRYPDIIPWAILAILHGALSILVIAVEFIKRKSQILNTAV